MKKVWLWFSILWEGFLAFIFTPIMLWEFLFIQTNIFVCLLGIWCFFISFKNFKKGLTFLKERRTFDKK